MKFRLALLAACISSCLLGESVETFMQKRWTPTQPEKVPASCIEKNAKFLTLHGIKDAEWSYFQVDPVKALAGNKIRIQIKAEGTGSFKVGFIAYVRAFQMVGTSTKVCNLADGVSDFDVTLPVPARTGIIRPVIILQPESKIKITDYQLSVTGTPEPAYTVQTIQNHSNALYGTDETALFTVEAKCNDVLLKEGTAIVTLRKNGIPQETEKYDLSQKNPFQFEVKCSDPGFMLATCIIKDSAGKTLLKQTQLAGAGFEPSRIKAGQQAPADLLSWWHGEYAKLKNSVPANVSIQKFKEDSESTFYKLQCDNFGGTKTFSVLSIPKGKGPFPMVFTVPPAGNTVYGFYSTKGAIRLTISVFDREFKSQADYLNFNRPDYYFYQLGGSRDSFYYYKAVLGVMRMMEYGMTQIKEWDGKHLAAVGRSQGGGFAFIMAALNPKIQAVSADVPALCDHYARKASRRPGWPQLLDYKNLAQLFSSHAAYYDAANFASCISCPTLVSVGFLDTMCEPASVYAAFNQLKGPKQIINCTSYGHGWGYRNHDYDKATQALLKETFSK